MEKPHDNHVKLFEIRMNESFECERIDQLSAKTKMGLFAENHSVFAVTGWQIK